MTPKESGKDDSKHKTTTALHVEIKHPAHEHGDGVDRERRQMVARIIHGLWTLGGSDISGLAPVLFDGRIDALGMYSTWSDYHHDETELPEPVPLKMMERIPCDCLTYQDFFTNCMLPNRPVIIQGLTDKWKAKQKWVKNVNGKDIPDLNVLSHLFGQDVAPVHVQYKRGFTMTRPSKEDDTVSDYAEWWREHHTVHQTEDEDERPLHYLKDWKFVAAHPTYSAYEWPHYFQDDWLNGGGMGNAYKFVYLGPAGTSTRLHADVLRSYSWSSNVCGRKRWYLVPPEYSYLLYDCFGSSLASHLHADEQDGVGAFFPGLARARRHAMEVIQEAGETIFVPSGWHHTVENLEPTLSINHNWLNGTNIHWSWNKLLSEIKSLHNHSDSFANDHSHNDLECVGPSADPSQVGDDLLLLWLIISKKANCVMANKKPAEGSMRMFNLTAILPILNGIQEVIRNGQDQGLSQRCECNIDKLVDDIRAWLASEQHDNVNKIV